MNIPPVISFRNMPHQQEIKDLVYEKCRKLDQFCDHVMSCRVAIEKTQKHQRWGNPYRVRLDITVPPGHEIIVRREPNRGSLHYPLTSVIRDAFQAAFRQLKELSEKQNRQTKKHPDNEINAFVYKIKEEEGYGFLKTMDNREIYFHQNSLLNKDLHQLKVGESVHYAEEIGDQGPQASSVHCITG